MAEAYLKCIECGTEFDRNERIYRCNCGDLLDIAYRFGKIEPEQLKEEWLKRRMSARPIDISGVWRHRELLPDYDEPEIITWPEGNTPVIEAPKCAKYVGLKRLKVKHLGLNPTGSFKDYGMTVGVTQAKHLGSKTVACASTGNTSASMTSYAARGGMKAVVFIPDKQIAFGKLSQALDYGAFTLQIKGDFDDAMRLVEEISTEPNSPLYMLNSINPYRLEGQKTIMFELMEQLEWKIPDRIVVPGGNMGNSSAFGLGLKQLYDLGFINKMPRVMIIQAVGADPLYKTLTTNSEKLVPVKNAHTLATAIKIGNPISWKKAERTLEWTDGWCDEVTEQEIADAKAMLGRDGIGCEPASATTVAGLKVCIEKSRVSGKKTNSVYIEPDEDVVCILTGNLLKDPNFTVNYHQDTLFERTEYRTERVSGEGKIKSTFGNRPIKVKSEKDEIKKLLGIF
jgi:threonine synthase